MDRWTALVLTAHRRLRLRRMLVAIERNPALLEENEMATPFLQGLTKAMDMLEHDLETDAELLTTKILDVRNRGKTAITKGHARIDSVAGRIGEVEKFVTAIEGSNGGGPLSGSSNSSGQSLKEGEQPKPEGETPPAAPGEQLTVNGVSREV